MGTPKNLTITSWLRERNEFGDFELVLAVPGIKLSGWWPNGLPDLDLFRDVEDIWPKGSTTILLEIDILEDLDGKKHQICAYARMLSYPERWLPYVNDS